jgi:hypothetical protein
MLKTRFRQSISLAAMLTNLIYLLSTPAISFAEPSLERKVENLPSANWQDVPGATLGSRNPVETSIDVKGLKRQGDSVTFDVMGYKGLYRRLQGNCQSRNLRVLREGRASGATTFNYVDISEKNAGEITDWHRTVLDYACRTSQISKTIEKQLSTQRYSVRYPSKWFVYDLDTDRPSIYNQPQLKTGGQGSPPFMIKTEVFMNPSGIDQLLQNPRRDGSTITKTQKVVINKRQAFRQWFVGAWDFDKGIVSFIPISNGETAMVASYYNSKNEAAETAIYRIHNSFELR